MLSIFSSRPVRLLAALFLTEAAFSGIAQQHHTIPVTAGTNMQVTVSPDGKTLLANVQGLIYSLPSSGGTAKQITQPLQEASHPDWSAKAGLVALQSYAGGTFHIWVMHTDGTGLKQITNGHGDDREPKFSPDGKTIVFSSDRAFEGSYDIWTVDVATGDVKRVTKDAADEFGPNWSPDGKSLVYVSGAGQVGIEIRKLDLATGQISVVMSTKPEIGRFEAPSFSPDGTKLA